MKVHENMKARENMKVHENDFILRLFTKKLFSCRARSG